MDPKARSDKLAAEVIRTFRANRVDALVRFGICECDAIYLSLDVRAVSKSQLFAKRLARKFAKLHALYFCQNEPSACPACLKPRGNPEIRQIEIGAFGVYRDELVAPCDLLAKKE